MDRQLKGKRGNVLFCFAVLFLDYPQIRFAPIAILKAFVEAQAKAKARKDLLAIRALDAGLAHVGGSLVEMSEDVMLEFAVGVDSQGNMSYPTMVAGEELQSEDDDESVQSGASLNAIMSISFSVSSLLTLRHLLYHGVKGVIHLGLAKGAGGRMAHQHVNG
ncbi:hypothetical protein EDD85DRAFT_790701 [Armillaria nabsnona]|nr:hypothetical protein EDD85DRAFT_790701 [Armillaria nabsnona]